MSNGEQGNGKAAWGYAVTKRLSVEGAVRKPKGFWLRPEQVEAFRAIKTTQDVEDAAEFYNTTPAGVIWRLRYMGLSTPAQNAKAESAAAEVSELAEVAG